MVKVQSKEVAQMPIRKRAKESWEIYLDTGLDPGDWLNYWSTLRREVILSQSGLP